MTALNTCYADMTAQRSYLTIDGTRLSYLSWGESGRPLVLLHGITSSARTWWRLAPALVAQGHHVYAFDMPGHGESDEISDHHIPFIASLIARAVRQIGLEQSVLIGHSWGGITSLTLANGPDAELFSRVVLIDPAVRIDPANGEERLVSFLNGVGEPPEVTEPMVRANNPDWHDCDVAWKLEAFVQCRANAVRGLFLHSGAWDASDEFSKLTLPTLLLVADDAYTVIPADLRAKIQASLPAQAHYLAIPNTTHNMFRGNGYQPTIDAIGNWLA
jgi:pimeloyl-ACP methyl ester carboxylesterase